jgi:hypothetical protein
LGSELLTNNFTCGRNATQYASFTNTATLIAGDEVGFHTNTDQGDSGIIHGGPAQLYMAKVPTGIDIKSFAGYEPSAQWFKIASFAQKNDTAWITLGLREVIPRLQCRTVRADGEADQVQDSENNAAGILPPKD